MGEEHHDDHVPLAIILTVAAGLCTVVGACLVFCISPERIEILPISLAFSAGVMIYVSLVEILGEAIGSFEEELEESHEDSHEYLAHIYGSLCFFGGILFGYGLDLIVHALGYHHAMPSNPKRQLVQTASEPNTFESAHESQQLTVDDNGGGTNDTAGHIVVEIPDSGDALSLRSYSRTSIQVRSLRLCTFENVDL